MEKNILGPARFHHIGMACPALRPEIETHLALGYEIESEPFHDSLQRINGIFLVQGGMRIELIEPAGEGSPVNNLLAKGIRMYHQCFEVDDLSRALQSLEKQGARLISGPVPAVAFHGRQIAFFMLRTRWIVELIGPE